MHGVSFATYYLMMNPDFEHMHFATADLLMPFDASGVPLLQDRNADPANHEPQHLETNLDIERFLASGRYSEAADLLGEHYEFILSTGTHAQIVSLLRRFPESLRRQHPWLLIAQARLHLTHYTTTGSRAEPLFKQAEERSRDAEDQQAIFASLREFGDWLCAQSRFTESVVSYRKALVFAGSDGERATVLANLALSLYMENGYSSEVQQLMSQALDLTNRSDLLSAIGRVLKAQADLDFMRGNFESALVSYGTAQKVMEGYLSRKERADLVNAVCYIHVLRGDPDKAEQTSHGSDNLLPVDPQEMGQHERAHFTLLKGFIALGRKLLPQASELLAQALALYRGSNDRVRVALTLDWLSELARRTGKRDEAIRFAEAGLEIRRGLGLMYEVGLSYITLGKALLGIEERDRARSYMARALEIAYTGDAKYRQAQTHLYLAALESLGESESSKRFSLHYHTQQALQLSRQNGYGSLFVSNGVLPVHVLVEALLEGIEAEYASGLLSAVAVADEPEVLALLNALSSHPSPAVKRARAAAIRAWGDAPAQPLHVRTLGAFSVTRHDGTVVGWSRSSSRSVFQYLLLHRSRPVPTEELVEVFWPGTDLGPARKNLHQAVTGLRHSLEPDIPSGFPSRYIQSAYEAYQLVLPQGSTVDNVYFSRQCTHLDSLADLETAAGLYTGDFLADNPYAEWAIPRRSQFSERYREILMRLASAYFDADRLTDCLTTAQRLLEHDPWNEDAVLWLMRVYLARGERTSALRAYRTMQKRLQDDFDVPVRSDIQGLYDEIARR